MAFVVFLELTHSMLITCRHFTLTVIVGGGEEINTSVIAGTNEDEATTL